MLWGKKRYERTSSKGSLLNLLPSSRECNAEHMLISAELAALIGSTKYWILTNRSPESRRPRTLGFAISTLRLAIGDRSLFYLEEIKKPSSLWKGLWSSVSAGCPGLLTVPSEILNGDAELHVLRCAWAVARPTRSRAASGQIEWSSSANCVSRLYGLSIVYSLGGIFEVLCSLPAERERERERANAKLLSNANEYVSAKRASICSVWLFTVAHRGESLSWER